MSREKRKGSILDLFLIGLILLSLIGIGMRHRIFYNDPTSEELKEHRMLLTVEGIDPRVVDCLSVGETLYTASGERYGTVTAIEVRKSEIVLVSNGEVYRGAWDQDLRCDLYLELSFFGREQDGRILWNGMRPALIGEELLLLSERTALTLRVAKCSIL